LAAISLAVGLRFRYRRLGCSLAWIKRARILPSSPMSLGTWCLTIYSLFLTAILAVEVLQADLFDLALVGGNQSFSHAR
jgi:hypothetical protein